MAHPFLEKKEIGSRKINELCQSQETLYSKLFRGNAGRGVAILR
jgi:hypothetical protein